MKLEDNLLELEKLVKQLESDDITLSESIAVFQRGLELTKVCMDELKADKDKIENIKANLDALLEE